MIALAALLLAAAVWWWGDPRATPTGRLHHLLGQRRAVARALGPEAQPEETEAATLDARLAYAACGAAALGCWLLVGGVTGAAGGAAIALLGPRVLGRIEPRSVRARREALESAAPMVADLMAACLASGASASAATRTVAQALDGPASELLRRCVSYIDLGADPTETWTAVAGATALAPIARAVTRSAQSGAPLADVLVRVADDLRSARKAVLETAARSAGIKAVGPLGLCFLPAFMLLGIVPLVASLIVQTIS